MFVCVFVNAFMRAHVCASLFIPYVLVRLLMFELYFYIYPVPLFLLFSLSIMCSKSVFIIDIFFKNILLRKYYYRNHLGVWKGLRKCQI